MKYRRVYRDPSGLVVDESVWIIDYETVLEMQRQQQRQQSKRQRNWFESLIGWLCR